MLGNNHLEKIPNKLQDTFNAMVAQTDIFCECHLNKEYAQLARRATIALCRHQPSLVMHGSTHSWACGIMYALGFINFLFDKSTQPYVNSTALCEDFGVSKAIAIARSKEVRSALKTYQLDPHWSLPSTLDNNPLTWIIKVDGQMVDARRMPIEIQTIAYKKGLIPYIPRVTTRTTRPSV